MEDVIVGLIVLVLGLAVCFVGLRLWFIMLPIWGFVAGFFLGAAGVEAIFGDGFLSTVSGWVVGAIIGVLFALVATLFWYVGAIIAAGSAGALIGSGLMAAFGVTTNWVVAVIAAIFAVAFVAGALLLALPIYIVVVNTAIAGATAAVAGVMLVFNRVDLDEMELGTAWTLIHDSWFWLIAWIILAALGLGAQLTSVAEARLPEERWTRTAYAV